jgi:hypothetical protein
MKYAFVLLLFFACSSCSIEGKLPSFSSDLLPSDIEGFQLKNVFSGSGTGQTLCDTVDIGDYYRTNPDGSIIGSEHVSAVVCESSEPEREWQRQVNDLYGTSENIKDFQLADGTTAKYYSPYDKHVYLLWRDGNFISSVSSMSESGNGHELSVTVATEIATSLRTIGTSNP